MPSKRHIAELLLIKAFLNTMVLIAFQKPNAVMTCLIRGIMCSTMLLLAPVLLKVLYKHTSYYNIRYNELLHSLIAR